MDGDVEVHFLTKKAFGCLVEHNPHVTKVHTIQKSVMEVLPELIKEGFDYIIDLHNNIRSNKIKRKLPGLSFTFKKLNWEKWLLVNFKLDKMPKKHIVDRYMDTLSSFGIVNDNEGLNVFIGPEDGVNLKTLPSFLEKGYIGFVVGGTYSTKKLPTQKIIEICNIQSKPVMLLGGKEDKDVADEITQKSTAKIYNACGLYSINQSASLVEQADKIITHDTGLMHVAAAFKKDVLSVWGNTVPEFGMTPYLAGPNSKIIEVKKLSCRPCSKLGFNKCPKKHFDCMNKIEIGELK